VIIGTYVPAGLRGLVIAGLMAAFMSTFDSTVNSGAAYIVRDWYQRYIHPGASGRRLVLVGYGASAALILVSMGIALRVESVVKAFGWIMLSLGAGVMLPNVLRWYWWRYNGWGFTLGVLSGIVLSVVQLVCFPDAPVFWYFPVISGGVLLVSVAAALVTRPADEAVLVAFYRSVRPGGLWGPVREKAVGVEPEFGADERFGVDFLNAVLAMPFFVCIYLAPIYPVIRLYGHLLICLGIAACLAVVLYFRWYKRLPTD